MFRSRAPAACVAIGLPAISLAGSARAQPRSQILEPDRPGDGEREEEGPGNWYGWQIAIADAAAGGVTYWGVEVDRAALLYGGLSLFIVIPPAIHGAHDRGTSGGAVLASFATRVLVPMAMFLSAARGRSENGSTGFDLEAEDQPQPSFGLMFFVSVLDTTFWSVPAVWSGPQKRERLRATLRPRIWLQPDHALLSAGGVF